MIRTKDRAATHVEYSNEQIHRETTVLRLISKVAGAVVC